MEVDHLFDSMIYFFSAFITGVHEVKAIFKILKLS